MLNTIYIPKTGNRNRNILSGNTDSNNDYADIELYSVDNAINAYWHIEYG